MNASPEGDAALTAMLRAQAPAIADDGFSARVLAALPPAKTDGVRPAHARWPWVAYVGGGLAGALFAVTHAGSWPDIVTGTIQLAGALSTVGATLTEPWCGLALILTAVSLAIALPFTHPRWRLW